MVGAGDSFLGAMIWALTCGHTLDDAFHGGPAGLDLEAVDVALASPGDLHGRDLKGKAVFFFSTDFFSRHSTVSNGAIKRIEDMGAAAIFVTLMIPGNQRYQFYPVNSAVPTL